jgi:hypothetical protein
MTGLIAHAGARKVDMEEVQATFTPPPTDTHFPISHGRLVDLVQSSFTQAGYSVQEAEYALKDGKTEHDEPIPGAQFFGLFQLVNGQNHPDYGLVVGLRNSHDKRFPAALALGSHVFVCDNLAFSGEVRLARKHTRHIMRDLPGVVARAVGKLGDMRQLQALRIDAYKQKEMDREEAYATIVEGAKTGALTKTRILDVVREWDKPQHEEFAPRNAWSLFNAFTEVLKGTALDRLQTRTQKLHGLMDLVCLHQLDAARDARAETAQAN